LQSGLLQFALLSCHKKEECGVVICANIRLLFSIAMPNVAAVPFCSWKYGHIPTVNLQSIVFVYIIHEVFCANVELEVSELFRAIQRRYHPHPYYETAG
jgi:hypothetical protein